jgi:hypothetical protein
MPDVEVEAAMGATSRHRPSRARKMASLGNRNKFLKAGREHSKSEILS